MADRGIAPAASDRLSRAEFDLQLHRAHLRAMRAVLRRDAAANPEVLTRLDTEIIRLEEELAGLPDDPGARPMARLALELGLSTDEIDFTWTAVALAANPPTRVHAGELDEFAAYGLTTALYCRMVELPAARARALGLALLTDHPAVRHGLLRVGNVERVPSAWTVAPALELIHHLAGEVRALSTCVAVGRPAAPILDQQQAEAVAAIGSALGNDAPLALFVEGPALTGRRTAVALATDRCVIAIELSHATSPAALTTMLLALRREAFLRGAVPVIAGLEDLGGDEQRGDDRARALAHFLDDSPAPVVLVSTRAGVDIGTRLPAVRIGWPVPDVATRGRLWSSLIGGPSVAAEVDPLAVRFPLGAGAIRRAIESARLLAGAGARVPLAASDLMAGVRHNIAERLGGVAERVSIRQDWDDLVLADDVMTQVRAVVARVVHSHEVYEQWGYRSKMPRGVGVAALFSGPPGTGKTMAAGLIAQELELDLYQIDLSKVVSKWVGETEKQLANVFDAAEAGHALLLFDEADALFGQRTSDVKGANDRYANLEVNYLLQRIERFGGVVILTTNLDASIDKALRRRLAAHVVFPHPDDDERSLLWQRLLASDDAPLSSDIDANELAQGFPKMTGANIRNAVLSAAFLAAAEGRTQIDHDLVHRAARGEYLAMGQVLSAEAPRLTGATRRRP